jgi:hypothetical protein
VTKDVTHWLSVKANVFKQNRGFDAINPRRTCTLLCILQKPILLHFNTFNAGIKSLRATLPDEIFYWGLCFLNRAFRKYMREKPTNAPIIRSVY